MTTTNVASSTFTPLLLSTTKPKANNTTQATDNNNNSSAHETDNNNSQQRLDYGTTITYTPSTHGLVHPASCIVATVVDQYYSNVLFSFPLCYYQQTNNTANQSAPTSSPQHEAQIIANWGSLLSSSSSSIIEIFPFQQQFAFSTMS
eukprot:UN03502